MQGTRRATSSTARACWPSRTWVDAMGGLGAAREGTWSGVQWSRGSPSLPAFPPRDQGPSAGSSRCPVDYLVTGSLLRLAMSAQLRLLLPPLPPAPSLHRRQRRAAVSSGYPRTPTLDQTDDTYGNSSTGYRDFDGSARSYDAPC